jgi:hypothetical protein
MFVGALQELAGKQYMNLEKLNSTLYVCPYLTGNTLRHRYEPNRLILSIGL